ncbi:hypothetical protein OnM2_061054 [Erysiphe neolycopersici]|uniref:Uncharacterized protein n=1 Tax=Erysiphe neolycopersici TaxID=212602 RepID=A0A420HP53_9PEZI|nr:hypothetical protein OnM2_061054 [Erysiphe neolycopersici]
MPSEVTLEGNQEVSVSYHSNTLVISGTNMSRARRQRRETISSKKRKTRKRDTAFWHRAIERPDTKPVDRLVARLCHIEHRSWKEIQEIVIEKTGVFNKIPAMQMKMTRLKTKMDADPPCISSILPISNTEEIPLQDSQQPLDNELCQWNCGPIGQPFSHNVFSSWACTPNGICEGDFAFNGINTSKAGWATPENMLSREQFTPPDSIYSYSLPDVSCNHHTSDIPSFEWPFEIQPAGNPLEYENFPRVSCQDFEREMSFSI